MVGPSRLIHVFSLLLLLLLPGLAEARLAYFSDYFSFVGQDARGMVAFALDTNRGQDGEEFQAEHFAVLHAEGEGWRELAGNGPFPNSAGILEVLPDSNHFRFAGTPEAGLLIESPANDLRLRISPIPILLARQHGNDRYRMGSAPATLCWGGRIVEGRVIYEFIHFENWNRLTRTYFGFWKDFHGLYLLLRNPATGAVGDLYLHRQHSERLASLTGMVDGFAVLAGNILRLDAAVVEVTGRRPAPGFYLWPASWQGRWRGEEEGVDLEFELQMHERETFANWIIGGFAMGIVKGSVHYRGERWQAYGLGEIIK